MLMKMSRLGIELVFIVVVLLANINALPRSAGEASTHVKKHLETANIYGQHHSF